MRVLRKVLRILRHPRGFVHNVVFRASRLFARDGLARIRLRNSRCEMYIDLRDAGISRDLYLHGCREQEATKLFKSYLRPGQIVLDIGANIGYYALLEAERVGSSGRVYAIEPAPRNCEILRKNVATNGYERVVDIECAAISDKTGSECLYLADRSNLHTLGRTRVMDSYVRFVDTVEVPAFSLDDFVEHKGINASGIDVIRMDIEGYELEVLNGMAEVISQAVSLTLFIEIHPKLIKERVGDAAYAGFLNRLKEYGFYLEACALSVSSREDRIVNVSEISDLAGFHEAIEVFLTRRAGRSVLVKRDGMRK